MQKLVLRHYLYVDKQYDLLTGGSGNICRRKLTTSFDHVDNAANVR